jgi:hypothetical protein
MEQPHLLSKMEWYEKCIGAIMFGYYGDFQYPCGQADADCLFSRPGIPGNRSR